MPGTQVYFEDVHPGMALPPEERTVTPAQMFLFSAVTRNPHRIHYDYRFALSEGHPDVLVHGPLQGAMVCTYLTRWAGPQGWLRKVSYRHRRPVTPQDGLILKGRVVDARREAGGNVVELEVWGEDRRGEVKLTGSAAVHLPSRAA